MMREALIKAHESSASPPLSPSEHTRLLVELLRPASPELARRWVAALLLVPESEREGLVSEVERRIVRTYVDVPESVLDEVEMHVVGPAVQRDGYIEQIHTTYTVHVPTPIEETDRKGAAGAG